jgi:hypothetical protein
MSNYGNWCALCLLTHLLVLPVQADEVTAQEYAIKAVFLFNLGSFVTWPPTVFEDSEESFNICILGRDPFGEILEMVVAEKTITDHPVAIRRLDTVSQITDCQELFVSNSEQANLPAIFEATYGKPILIVGDMPDFILNGGMLQFYPRDDKIRLMLDPQAFEEAGLKPSANLMRIAQLVRK